MTGDNVFAAKYDDLSRLTEWTRDNNAVKMEYFYDALGRVTRKQSLSGTSSETYRYYYDDQNRLIEMICPETLKEWKFYYSGRSLEAFQVNNNLYFYHFDHLGNTIALSDQNGIIVQTYVYDPWGKILEASGDIVQPFKFSGAWGVIHEDNFLYRMPFRFYDSYTGRFIQRDPAGFIDGVNLYRYAGNNPVNNIDPTGLYDLMTIEVDEYLEDPSLNRYEDQPEIDYDKQKEVDDLLYQNQRDIMWGKVEDLMCEAMRILVPGVSAGDSYSQGRPWYEVAMEYAKHIPLIKYPTHVIRFFYYHGSKLQEVNKESNHSIPIINPNPHHVVQY
jgi:RHS repeat-associated protein